MIVDGAAARSTRRGATSRSRPTLARGYEGAIAQKVNSPWVWLPLCLLFVAPFFDPRRPLRLLHLDLLVLLGLGVSLFFFNRAEITASVALTYPVLGYFLVRMLVAGLLAARARRDRWCRWRRCAGWRSASSSSPRRGSRSTSSTRR